MGRCIIFWSAPRLSERDAALAARLAYGTLQNRSMCDFYLSNYSKIRLSKIAPRVLDVLRMTAYQLTMLDRIPAHAAVGEAINLIRKYCRADPRTVGFANGVLRAIARDSEAGLLPRLDCPDKESYYALRYSHPEWFIRYLSEQFGQKEAERIAAANNEAAPLSVRVNRLQLTPNTAAERAWRRTALQSRRMKPWRTSCCAAAVISLRIRCFKRGRLPCRMRRARLVWRF